MDCSPLCSPTTPRLPAPEWGAGPSPQDTDLRLRSSVPAALPRVVGAAGVGSGSGESGRPQIPSTRHVTYPLLSAVGRWRACSASACLRVGAVAPGLLFARTASAWGLGRAVWVIRSLAALLALACLLPRGARSRHPGRQICAACPPCPQPCPVWSGRLVWALGVERVVAPKSRPLGTLPTPFSALWGAGARVAPVPS
jgi:hypothetical protein